MPYPAKIDFVKLIQFYGRHRPIGLMNAFGRRPPGLISWVSDTRIFVNKPQGH